MRRGIDQQHFGKFTFDACSQLDADKRKLRISAVKNESCTLPLTRNIHVDSGVVKGRDTRLTIETYINPRGSKLTTQAVRQLDGIKREFFNLKDPLNGARRKKPLDVIRSGPIDGPDRLTKCLKLVAGHTRAPRNGVVFFQITHYRVRIVDDKSFKAFP